MERLSEWRPDDPCGVAAPDTARRGRDTLDVRILPSRRLTSGVPPPFLKRACVHQRGALMYTAFGSLAEVGPLLTEVGGVLYGGGGYHWVTLFTGPMMSVGYVGNG